MGVVSTKTREISMLFNPRQNPILKALYDAADLIDQNGLSKWSFESSDGSFCIRGAISEAVVGDSDFWGTYNGCPTIKEADRAVTYYLRQRFDYDFELADWNSADWNNEDHRTKEEVVEALRGAAEMVIMNGC
jgi:hypothetical protein